VVRVDLEDYLKRRKVWHRFILKPETVHTVDAARVAGIDLQRVTKNLVSQTDEGEYVLLIVPGDRNVNLKAAANVLGVKRVHLVPFEKAEDISGYPPGGTPSIGHKTRMKVIVDKSLLRFEMIYCGGGSRNKLLELRTTDALRLNDSVIAEISS